MGTVRTVPRAPRLRVARIRDVHGKLRLEPVVPDDVFPLSMSNRGQVVGQVDTPAKETYGYCSTSRWKTLHETSTVENTAAQVVAGQHQRERPTEE